jgi:hypothetical protein
MAGETTALAIFSMRSVHEELRGPANSRLWRPGFLAALVEKHFNLWVITPISYGAKSIPLHQIVSCDPNLSGPLELSLMPFMASIFSQENVQLKAQAKKEGLLHASKGTWWINGKTNEQDSGEEFEEEESGFTYPSSKLYEMSLPIVAKECRVTTIPYPHSALLQHDGVQWMRSIGIDVDEFIYKTAGVVE